MKRILLGVAVLITTCTVLNYCTNNKIYAITPSIIDGVGVLNTKSLDPGLQIINNVEAEKRHQQQVKEAKRKAAIEKAKQEAEAVAAEQAVAYYQRPTTPVSYENTYSPGWCTWYVANRRRIPNTWGNADTWYYYAQQDGYAVGSLPRVGAVAWQSLYTHVAYVEAVYSNGTALISEMNAKGLYIVSQRVIHPNEGWYYIY